MRRASLLLTLLLATLMQAACTSTQRERIEARRSITPQHLYATPADAVILEPFYIIDP